MKKLLLLMFIGMLMISTVSAWDWDNVIAETGTDANTGLPTMEISNCNLWVGIPTLFGTCLNKGETLFEGAVTEHTKQCGTDCESKIEINHSGGILIDDIRFLTEQKDNSWINQDVRSYEFKYEAELPEYETQCTELEEICTWSEENQTNSCYTPQTCEQAQIGTYTGFKTYNVGESLPEGNYEMFLEAKKKPSRTVDWQIKVEGRWMEEWAVWGGIIGIGGVTANVTLNSPENNNISYTPSVTLNATANVTNGAYLTNMSLWTNLTGSWLLNETKTLPETSYSIGTLLHYFTFDNTLYDKINTSLNFTESGGSYNSSGKVGSSRAGYDDYIPTGTPVGFTGKNTLSFSAWIYPVAYGREYWFTSADGVSNADATISAFHWDDGDFTTQFMNGNTVLCQLDTAQANVPINQWNHIVGTLNTSSCELIVNNVSRDVQASTGGSTKSSLTDEFWIMSLGGGYYQNDGWIDEFAIWDEDLNTSQIDALYNNGLGRSYGETSYTETWSKTISDTTIWNVQACDTDGDCGFATSNYTVLLDTIAPTVSVESPTGIYDYGYLGEAVDVNVTFTDTNLESCWYDYNGTNITIDGCLTGVKNSTSISLEKDNYNLTFYANDSVSNLLTETTNWSYKIFEVNRIVNNQSYETQSETFSINLTANSSLTEVKLVYNGTEYSTTKTDTVYNKTFDLPTSLGNNSVRWKFTYGGDTIYSDYSYQQVNETIFTLCNSSYTDKYLNMSFRDEATLTPINVSLPLAQFEYYLGSGTVTKDYEYINAVSQEYNYTFCATPNLTLHVDPYIQYSATGYPQRIWNPDVIDYTSTMTTQILYLLSSTDGLYTTLQVINSADQLISGVLIEVVRAISGTDVTVASGTTNAAGSVTYWLNPDFSHDFTLSKTGYTTYETSFAPTQTSYTFTIGGSDGNIQNSTQKGIDYEISPGIGTLLYNGTDYTFAYYLTSGFYDVTDYGFNLRLANGTEIDGGNTGTEGTNLTLAYNTANESYIYIDYYWTVNGETIERSSFWLVQNTEYTGWSIRTFADDFSTYLASGIFGLDDFGRLLITFMILFFSVGIMSYKYGFNSPMAINTLVFAVVFFLDIGLGLIPDLRGISNLPTYVAALILVITVIREGQR